MENMKGECSSVDDGVEEEHLHQKPIHCSYKHKFVGSDEDSGSEDDDSYKRPRFGMAPSHSEQKQFADVPTVASSFIKTDGASKHAAVYNNVAKKLMAKMGFKEGEGLGKHGQGITAPVEASKQKGRRGLGHQLKGFEQMDLEWDFEREEVSVDEVVEWLQPNQMPVPSFEEMLSWITTGKKKLFIDDETRYCSEEILGGVLSSKSVFDNLESEEMRKARTRSNPYETIRGAFFLNRAAMKMANMDAVLNFMFTSPKDSHGRSLVGPNELLYFADVCAGPGGFSEYVLWRHGWETKGFGFTLKGSNDFKLDDFFAAPCELFEPHYGINGADGDGDIFLPENLNEFRKFVMENTDNCGVHFVMADGGFSVEGQENIQEILSKRLYLCQFLCALMILRPGGNFVCKLFDLFTPFSVGLVYLMYRAFDRVAIFKPVTSRPANSERYIICQGKRADSEPIQQYMFEINKRLGHIWTGPGVISSDTDILEIVSSDLIENNQPFLDYIYDSNVKLGERQIISLVKIQAFARNNDLHEPRQSEIRQLCLEKWKIPDQLRTAPDKSEKPANRFSTLVKDSTADYFGQEPFLLSSNALSDKVKSIYDYRCVVVGAEQRVLLLSLGRSHVFRSDLKISNKWSKVDDVKIELPKDTVLEVEFVQEFRGEGKGQRRVMAVHVIDALFLCGTDVRTFHHHERIEKAKKFVKAITRPTRSDLAPIRVVEPVRFEQIESVFERLQMKLSKGSGHNRKLSYCDNADPSRYIVPTGLLFIRTVNDPWMMAMSRSQGRKYYFHTVKHEAKFETPKDSVASYLQCLKSRLYWQWNDSAQIGEDQSTSDTTNVSNSGNLTRRRIVQFVHNKLGSA